VGGGEADILNPPEPGTVYGILITSDCIVFCLSAKMSCVLQLSSDDLNTANLSCLHVTRRLYGRRRGRVRLAVGTETELLICVESRRAVWVGRPDYL